jgi:hypothetical protein
VILYLPLVIFAIPDIPPVFFPIGIASVMKKSTGSFRSAEAHLLWIYIQGSSLFGYTAKGAAPLSPEITRSSPEMGLSQDTHTFAAT